MNDRSITLRPTGIECIGGDVPWGTHFCQFYETPQDLIDILVPYFKTGLEHNEYCMWVTSEPLSHKDAEQALRAAMPDFDTYVKRAAIEIMPHTEWYLVGGRFDRERVLAGWVQRTEDALSRGFDGLRLTGNTFWLESALWNDFYEYEAIVNSVIGRYRMIALCTYSLEKCGAAEVIDVVQNHQFSLIKRQGRWTVIEKAGDRRARDDVSALNRQLQQRSLDLEAAVQELQSFGHALAHDLRAPLRAIDGYARLLADQSGVRLDDEGRRLLDVIRDNSALMGRMLDDLLGFARIGRVELHKEAVDMTATAQSAWEEAAPLSGDRTVSLDVASLPEAVGDRLMLRQVLFNLLANALKATRDVASPHIEVGCQVTDGEQVYYVRDNGMGFDMQYAGRLFGAFQRLHGVEQFPGTGLGLAIVKRIVMRHGGRVWAEAKPGAGATFYFALPTVAASGDAGMR